MTKFQSAVLFMGGILIIHLIEGVHLFKCPSFQKHEAFRLELLSDRAICRAQPLEFDDLLCLNGYRSAEAYCSTGSCNIFGYNCDGHCLTGDDSIDIAQDLVWNCNVTLEIEKFCDYYQNVETTLTLSGFVESIFNPTEFDINDNVKTYGYIHGGKHLKRICPNVPY